MNYDRQLSAAQQTEGRAAERIDVLALIEAVWGKSNPKCRAVAELVEDARLLACALAGAYAAMDMEPPPATAPLLERYLGIKDADIAARGVR